MPSELRIQWLPLLPWWAVVLAAAAFLALQLHGSLVLRRKEVPGRQVLALAGLRVLIGVVLVLLLLRPVVSYKSNEEQLPALAVLVDTSQSMDRPGGKEGQSRLDEVREALDRPVRQRTAGPLSAALFRFRPHRQPFAGWPSWRTAPDGHPDAFRRQPGCGGRNCSARRASAPAVCCWPATAMTRAPTTQPRWPGGSDSQSIRWHQVRRRTAPRRRRWPSSLCRTAAACCSARRRISASACEPATPRLPAPVTVRLTEDGKEVASGPCPLLRPGRPSSEPRSPTGRDAGSITRYEFRLDDGPPGHALTVQVVDGKTEVLILEDTWPLGVQVPAGASSRTTRASASRRCWARGDGAVVPVRFTRPPGPPGRTAAGPAPTCSTSTPSCWETSTCAAGRRAWRRRWPGPCAKR